MKGYGSRVLEEEFNSVELPAIGTLMLKTNWKEQLITPELQPLVYDQHLVICCEMAHFNIDDVSPEIMRQISGIRWLNLQSNRQGAARQHIAQRFEDYAVQVFKEIQSILITKPAGRIFIQVIISNQGESQLFGGLSGLLKTTRLENPKLTGQIIEVNPEEELHGIITKLKENSQSPHDQFIRYQDGKRSVFSWTELETLQELIPWRDGGIYLITGGSGALGQIFAKEIATQVKNSVLILTGRSQLSAEKSSQLKEIEKSNTKVRYQPMDITKQQQVSDLIQKIREEFGGLHGIIHSAGVINDNFIIKKTKRNGEGSGPKVSGLVNLDLASRDLESRFLYPLFLDFGKPGEYWPGRLLDRQCLYGRLC